MSPSPLSSSLFPSLFQPLELRHGVVAPNRVWLAPLTNMQSHADGTASDAEIAFLGARADGGFGLVETCAAHVMQQGKAWPGELGCHDDAMVPGLRRIAERIHGTPDDERQTRPLASVQLFHGGLRADPAVSGLPRLGASADVEPELAVQPATPDDLTQVIDAFARAAVRCEESGFDAVELHGAHGYLLSQFLSTTYNTRRDDWGGPLEHRARLIRSVTQAVRVAAPTLALCVRLSPEDFGQAKGLDLDESIQVARWLADDGMDVLHLSLWRSALPTSKRPSEHAVAVFRAALPAQVRIVAAGQIWTGAEADALLQRGADAVALGRAAIANHDWPARIAAGRPPQQPPLSPAQLEAEAVSPGFVDYLRKWKGFVA